MSTVTVTLPDGSQKQAPQGQRIADFVKESIGAGLAKAAYFAKIDGAEVDLSRTLEADAKLQIFTTKTPEALDVARHDAAHIVADAVQELFPGTQVTIGPTIEDGFITTSRARSRSPPKSCSRSKKRRTRSSPPIARSCAAKCRWKTR